MADETPEERAIEAHRVLVEILKHLNRADEEERDVEGLERAELFLLLRKGPCPYLTETDLGGTLDMLLANGLARCLEDPVYAWDRGRVLGARYTVTLGGKEYLLKQLERTGRIE